MAALTIYQGKDFIENLPVLNPDGSAYDLTGATLWFTVKLRSDQSQDDALASIKLYRIVGGLGDGITVTVPATGIATISMTAAQTEPLTIGESYVYDLQVKDTTGRVFTAFLDALYVSRPVTQRVTTP